MCCNRNSLFRWFVFIHYGAVMFWAYTENAVELYYKFKWAAQSRKEDWLDRLALFGVIEEEDYHREIGKGFNISKCCREWFIYLACTVGVKNPATVTNKIYGEDLSCDYVRCPKCRKGE